MPAPSYDRRAADARRERFVAEMRDKARADFELSKYAPTILKGADWVGIGLILAGASFLGTYFI